MGTMLRRLFALVVLVLAIVTSSVFAQGNRPAWLPPVAKGKPAPRWYYLPACQSYYDTQRQLFWHKSSTSNNFTENRGIPMNIKVNLYTTPVVALNYKGTTAFTQFATHRKQYPKTYRVPGQKPRRRS